MAKRKKWKISHKDVDAYVGEFLKNGGKIKHCATRPQNFYEKPWPHMRVPTAAYLGRKSFNLREIGHAKANA